jgi:hypothetical protein
MVRDSFMTRRARELRQEQTSAEKRYGGCCAIAA